MMHLSSSASVRTVRMVCVLSVVVGSLIALLAMSQVLLAAGSNSVILRYVNEDGGIDTGDCSNPASPCETIAYGLGQSSSGDSIFVAEGTYTENLTVNIPVALFGGYIVSGSTWLLDEPGFSVIDGSSLVGNPAVTFQGTANGAILNGFTVTGGSVITDGGGISIQDVAPIIQSCIIKGNTGGSSLIEWGGGGMAIGSSNGLPVIISDTIIMSNTGTGGASGIRIGGQALVTLINTVIAQNSGRFAIHTSGQISLTLINSTIANQVNDGGILLNQASRAVITNSVIWEPSNQALALADVDSVFTVTYSDVSDGVQSGAGNLSIDPKFIGASDYHLKVSSPVIDKGTSIGAPIADLEGTVRDARPDMGAYEWVGFHIYLPLAIKNH